MEIDDALETVGGFAHVWIPIRGCCRNGLSHFFTSKTSFEEQKHRQKADVNGQ